MRLKANNPTAWTGTFVTRRAAIYHDPVLKADGSIVAGAVLDSGQTVINNVGTAPVRYSSGRIVHTNVGAIGTYNAGYLMTQVAAGRVRRMGAYAAWPANALGTPAFVIPSAAWDAGASTMPVAGFHYAFNGNGVWTGGVFNPAVGQTGHVEADKLVLNAATAVTLAVTTPAGTQTTGSLSVASMTAVSLKTAIEALSNVGAGNTTVVGPFAGMYGIVYAPSLGLTGSAVSASTGSPAPVVTKYASGGVTTAASYLTNGRFATVWDNALRLIDVWLYPELAQAIIFFPDGTNSGVITDPGINLWTASYAVHELFEGNLSAVDVPAVYGKLFVDNGYHVDDSPDLNKADLAATLTAAGPQTLYEGGNSTGADIVVGGSIPPGTKYIELVAIGGGASAGSGCCTVSGTAGNGGGSGGTAGIIREMIPASALGTAWSGVVGHPGTGALGVSVTGNGNNGVSGTLTKFLTGNSAYQALGGGNGGGGGTAATVGTAGGAGGPFASSGVASVAAGAAGANGAGITASLGVAGSASGGGISTVPAASNGGVGGSNLVRGYTGGTAGVVGGALPGVGKDISAVTIAAPVAGVPGPGVGGGAASITGPAQAGATPLMYGNGGAGGGASLNGSLSGAGGNGGPAYLLVRAHFF